MIIDQLFTRPLFEQAPMASPEQLAYNKLRAQYDSYQAMTGGGGNTAVSRDPAHAAKLAKVPAEIARMAAALKAKGIDAEAQYDALSGPAAAPVDANQAYGGISEATYSKREKAQVMIYKYFGQIYDYGDDDGLNYLDEQGELWNQLMDKYNGEIEDIVAREPTDVLVRAAQELKVIADEMEFDLDEAGVAEGSDQQLSVRQLATISDEALDKAYGYGRSSPGNTFGWQANLKSAAYAKHMIDKGVTDIDEIADAIHKGWNVTARAFVKNPNRFDDTEKLKAAGKLEAKLQQRAKLMNIDYSQLPDDEQEKDRVVARALLQAITGGGEQDMSEGEYDSRKPFGVRYKVFAGREGRMTTREYWTSSEEKLQRAVDKIQALDNFYEIDGYSYPKEPQGVTENAEDLHIGDPVIITGNGIKFEGATGEIVDFGQQHRFVVVDLYNHGRHSFHSSDVSFNEYAGSDDEEARMYDAGEFGDDYRDEMDGYSYPKESQGVAEGSESAIQKIEKKIQAKRDALGLAREQRRARGQHQQGQREIKIQAEIDRLSNELTQLKKQGVAEGKHFKTAYGWAGGSKPGGGTYKHPDQIKADREAKKKAKEQEQEQQKNKQPDVGVAEGSEQKPAITYKDYTLQYDYQTEDDDPEGYSTATTYYFDVLKDGDRVGEAEYFDYFGNLTIRINGKTKEFGFRHPLASQISQLVSSLPDEQKKDLSDPRFESQDLTEVFADQGSGSTDRDNADYMKRRNAAKKKGYTGRETKAGTWRVFKDGNAVAVAGPFKSADEAAAWIKKHKQGITEMDKSQPAPGRDIESPPGPDKEAKPISAKKATRDAGRMLNRAFKDFKDSHKKKDVTESDTLMLKLQRAMVQEGRVKELADDLKTMPDADFMKKYGKAKAAIRRDMSRIDEKLSTSDTLSRPAASASSSGKAIDDPDIMGSLKSASTPKFDRFSKTDSEPKIDFRAGLVGGEPEVEAEPRLMVDPLPDMQKWGGKFATGSAGGDNRFTAPAGWRYVEKGEDPARYGSEPAAAAAGGRLPDLKYDPQSRTLKSTNAPALDMSPKSKFKFDRAAQSQVPVDGPGANPNIDNATRDRARSYAAQQNAPADAAKKVDWKTIYALNKATIGSNPNVIRPRMQLNMPNGTIYLVQPGDTLTKIAAKQSQINELSTDKLAQYKTAAARDARAADQEGDFKRGDKRFSGIVQATKKQFDNDAKKVDESRAARRALMAKIVNGN